MLSIDQVNFLGQAIDTTWGKSSMSIQGGSIKAQLSGDKMIVTYHCIGTFVTKHVENAEIKKYEAEGAQRSKDAVTEIKRKYKELSGKALKLKSSGKSETCVDIIGTQTHVSAKRMAHIRYVSVFTIE